MIDQALYILSLLTLLLNAALVVAVFVWVIAQFSKKLKRQVEIALKNLVRHAVPCSLTIVLFASLGSLYSSEIAGLEPCKLCWFQRTAMFPLVIVFAVALIKKIKQVHYFSLPLSVIGLVMAGYQYYLQLTFDPSTPCVVGGMVSCTQKYIFHFGFITIPWMSFTGFFFVFLLGLLALKKFDS